MIHCGNILCIYEQNGQCILSYISLDRIGSCESCIEIELPKDIVAETKKKSFFRIENK